MNPWLAGGTIGLLCFLLTAWIRTERELHRIERAARHLLRSHYGTTGRNYASRELQLLVGDRVSEQGDGHR